MDSENQVYVALVLMIIFGAFWIFLAIPIMENTPWFVNLSPLVAYPLYSIGNALIIAGIFSAPLSYFISGEIELLGLLRGAVSSFLSFSLILDNWTPPYFLSPSGQILISLGTKSLEVTAVDAWLWAVWKGVPNMYFFGISTLYILVYFVSPAITLLAIALLLKPREFLEFIGLA